MRTTAIIPAAGAGSRMNREISKQYLSLGGKPLLIRTLEALEASPLINALLVVVPREDVDRVRMDILAPWNLMKVAGVLAGGRERQDSVRAGIDALDGETDLVLIHDAVRPFITPEIIERCILAGRREGAATAGVPVKDTVKEVGPEGLVSRTCDRSVLWLTQTPQVFKRSIIEQAHRAAVRDGFLATDDTALVERLGMAVRMVPGDYGNIKITTPEDLSAAEVMLRLKAERTS